MSIPAPANRLGPLAVTASVVAFLLILEVPVVVAAAGETAPTRRRRWTRRARPDDADRPRAGQHGQQGRSRDPARRSGTPAGAARRVCQVGSGPGRVRPVVVDGESYIDVSAMPDLDVKFDAASVTLDLRVPARALPATTMNLGPDRRTGVLFPADSSFFVNYGLNANGDESFGQRQYQFATEFGARTGNWLLYNTTSQQWGSGTQNGFTRLLTNVQYDERGRPASLDARRLLHAGLRPQWIGAARRREPHQVLFDGPVLRPVSDGVVRHGSRLSVDGAGAGSMATSSRSGRCSRVRSTSPTSPTA